MEKKCPTAFLHLLILVVALFLIIVANTDKTRRSDLIKEPPWNTLSYSAPVEMAIFTDTDSICWEIQDEPTLNWFFENFNDFEIAYIEGGTNASKSVRDLYILVECENGDGLSLLVTDDNKLVISENTTISGENLRTPPAGVYSIGSEFDFDVLWAVSRRQNVSWIHATVLKG